MKQGSRVSDKVTGKTGIIEVVLAPGMPQCAVVRWDGHQEGYYALRSQLEELRNTA